MENKDYKIRIRSKNSLVAQTVKNLPAMWETQGQSLGWEDPLEKGIATHLSILAWRIPRTEKPGGQQSMGSQRVRHEWAINTHCAGNLHRVKIYRIFQDCRYHVNGREIVSCFVENIIKHDTLLLNDVPVWESISLPRRWPSVWSYCTLKVILSI